MAQGPHYSQGPRWFFLWLLRCHLQILTLLTEDSEAFVPLQSVITASFLYRDNHELIIQSAVLYKNFIIKDLQIKHHTAKSTRLLVYRSESLYIVVLLFHLGKINAYTYI